jgi:hypothetical protein
MSLFDVVFNTGPHDYYDKYNKKLNVGDYVTLNRYYVGTGNPTPVIFQITELKEFNFISCKQISHCELESSVFRPPYADMFKSRNVKKIHSDDLLFALLKASHL